MTGRQAVPLLLGGLGGAGCSKVPIFDVEAGFSLADASWFAEEETLFAFYEVSAEQGIGAPSVIEITYSTDEERVPWTDIATLETVHTHLPVDCGEQALCGSLSLHVPLEPREVEIRLRYHRDGELSLDADTVFNVVDEGPPHTHRSLLVYGVFDASNQWVQWRSRNQLPTVRNQQAEALGLRRDLLIAEQRFGTAELVTTSNPYGYGVSCPATFTGVEQVVLQTNERAISNVAALPVEASTATTVCAQATVTDATGTFTTDALARKNPEVRPAFPVLRSPIHEATPIRFFLAPCDRTISEEHAEMQRQRLLLGDVRTFCIDDWAAPGFADTLAEALSDAVEAERPKGSDMVLVIGLHRDESGVPDVIEDALAQVVPEERHHSTPRLSGALVFDSIQRGISRAELSPVVLWCPATVDLSDPTQIINASSLSCGIAPDIPDLALGPFSFGFLPILPTRTDYLDFIDTYSEAQAGEVTALTFRTPEFATTSDHVDLGDYGVVTFLNGEVISADADDAFSYCVGDDSTFFAFRSALMQSEEFALLVAKGCEKYDLPEDVCAAAELGLLPLEWIGEWHTLFGEGSYELGIFWDFPFLLRMEYETYVAGSVTAFGLSVPFGVVDSTRSYLGSQMWLREEFSLEERLTQCRRFCDHPTFDSAGVYNVNDVFRESYTTSCYLPLYPEPGDHGFPRDP